jgi:hypothetical protein
MILNKYTNPSNPGSFSGLSGFKKNNKFVSYKKLLNFPTYSLHKQVIRKFPRRQTIVNKKDEMWQVDLIDVRKYKFQNSHYEYILVCIDSLSKFAWAEPIKKKTAEACAQAFSKIFKKGREPQFCYADLGNEWKGPVRDLFKKKNITLIGTHSIHKASIIERFNRTLKTRMERYYTDSNSHKYIHVLQEIVDSYNNSYHSSIKMAPAKVNVSNLSKVKENLYGLDQLEIENDYHVHFAFKIGDYVRLAIKKSIFEKGYSASWSEEIFIISFLNPSNPQTYKIKTLKGEEIDWNYYKQELQFVSQEEFPYDSFEILDENKNKQLAKKLNSEDQTTRWIPRIQPSRSVKK